MKALRTPIGKRIAVPALCSGFAIALVSHRSPAAAPGSAPGAAPNAILAPATATASTATASPAAPSTRARSLHPAALAFVPYGIVLVRARVRVRAVLRFCPVRAENKASGGTRTRTRTNTTPYGTKASAAG